MTDGGRGPRHYRVSTADRFMTPLRYIGIVGPVAQLSAGQVRATMSELTARGPHTRIGLNPAADRTRWRWDPVFPDDAVHEAEPVGSLGGVAQAVASVRRRDGHRHPVEITICGEYLFVDCCHGVADGKLYIDIVEALYATARDDTAWAVESSPSVAMTRSVASWFGRHPSRLRQGVRASAELSKSSRSLPQEVVEGGPAYAWKPSPAVVISHSGAEVEQNVSRWRKKNLPGVGPAAVALVVVRRAIASAGLESKRDAIVMVNCRRYLPANVKINGNFVIGLSVSMGEEDPIERVAGRLDAAYRSGLPLAWQAYFSTLTRLGRRNTAPRVPDTVSAAPRVELIYSDLGRPPGFSDLPWTTPEVKAMTGLLDPAGPEAITVMCGVVDGQRTYSASFHDNVFDPDAVRHALQMAAEEPMSFLQGWSAP